MAYKVTNIKGVLEIMRSLQKGMTQAQYAKSIGVSPQFLSDVYAMRRDPGEKILSALGIESDAYMVPEALFRLTSEGPVTESIQRRRTRDKPKSKKAKQPKK
jgi:transcriptional regulator with XRE-family HTH domain